MSDWAETRSYRVRIIGERRLFEKTAAIYCDAIRFLVPVVNAHFDELEDLQQLERQRYIERLVHGTKGRSPFYPGFDRRFYKFPSYLRRAAITEAVGIVSSWRSNLADWEAHGHMRKTARGYVPASKPRLSVNHAKFPVLFKGNMYLALSSDMCAIKVFNGHDWVWATVLLNLDDAAYLARLNATFCSPVIGKNGHRWSLRFSTDVPCSGEDTVSKVCAVDLGLNHDAVCSAISADGTVSGRRFIDHPEGKDHLYRILDEIRAAHKAGSIHTPRSWRFADGYQTFISTDTALQIVRFAAGHGCQVIVFEHLNPFGKRKGSKKQRLALWRYREIQEKTEAIAHKHGIRISTVYALGTSKYAYDGSGEVTRDAGNYSLCTFKSGKRYNADLSASYNIGARYFIRSMLAGLTEETLQALKAKVPSAASRTTCTLATLVCLHAVLGSSGILVLNPGIAAGQVPTVA